MPFLTLPSSQGKGGLKLLKNLSVNIILTKTEVVVKKCILNTKITLPNGLP